MRSTPAQDNAVSQVKEAAQIVDIVGEVVALKRSGANLKGLCPFHGEKTPSFMVNPARQSYHCFGCGEGGDVFSFLMQYHRMTFPEALRNLAERYHIELPEQVYSAKDQAQAEKREILYRANERAAGIYQDFLQNAPGAAAAREYMKGRGIPDTIIESFRIGYAPPGWDFLSKKIGASGFPLELAEEAGLIVRKENGRTYDRFRDRILFPISDLTGKIVGFGGRILGEGTPKYLNSPETLIYDKSRSLFGLFQHREQIRRTRRCLIVEGNFDLLALASNGVDYVVAPLGTALTQAQIRILKGFADEMILLFDGDAAGVNAALRAAPIFLSEQVLARIVVLPAEDDPDTYIRKHGREKLEKLLESAQELLEFVFVRLQAKHGDTLEGKARILAEMRPMLDASADNPLQHSVLVSHFSDKLNLDPGQVIRGMQDVGRSERRMAPVRDESARLPPEEPVSLSRVERQLLEFLIIYPRFVEEFVNQGLEEVLVEPTAVKILAAIRRLINGNPGAGPEELLEMLPAGPERAFVAQWLISAPNGEDNLESTPEKIAEEKLLWLALERLQRIKRGLTEEIMAAQQEGDSARLQDLIVRKMAIDQKLAALQE